MESDVLNSSLRISTQVFLYSQSQVSTMLRELIFAMTARDKFLVFHYIHQ